MSQSAKKAPIAADLQSYLNPKLSHNIQVVDAQTHSLVDPNRSILVTHQESPQDILERFLNNQLKQICQTDAGSFEREINASALMLQNPQHFLDFPLAAILRPSEVNHKTENSLQKMSMQFSGASQKTSCLEQVRHTLGAESRSESLIADALLIVDELFTNAVFNAPFVNLKSGVNKGVDRNDSTVQMGQNHKAEFLLGFDQECLALVCRDSYGSLNVQQLLQRIHDCYSKGISAAMRQGAGGAGIGSQMVFNASSSMYICVKRGQTTVVAACLQWLWSNRRRSEASKNLHCFEI